jgi:hypothetical protein
MNDDSTNKDIENTEAELVDPDETELIDQKKLGEDYSSLLPTVAKGTSVARIDPLTAYLNEIRRYEYLTEN